MSSRTNPWKRIGRPDYDGVHLMPFDLKNRAITHEMNRQRVVTQIMLDLYCMAVSGFIEKGMPISLKGAVSQNLKGSRAEKTEAAHCVPRQLLIGIQKPQEILKNHYPVRAFALDAIFAETDILPANFNKSDSRAERNGLSEAFRVGCQTIIHEGQNNGEADYDKTVMIIRKAFTIYKKEGLIAFQESLNRLNTKLEKFRSRIQTTADPKDKIKWKEQFTITKHYKETLQQSLGADGFLEMGRIDGIFRLYELI